MRQTISVEPVYVRLANLLEEMIRGRSLRPGDRVPSVRHFSEQQRVSVPTALHAYTTLETRGLIEARPKSGFFVRARLADLVREPDCCAEKPKVSNLANLDPLDSLLSDHSDPKLVPLGVALPSVQLLPTARLGQMMGDPRSPDGRGRRWLRCRPRKRIAPQGDRPPFPRMGLRLKNR